ncbi:MAG: hypothetical protein J5927_02150 [Oscillospiraceae bacterium]|nr:hypothetical protein [Oscillospiraceae bacterium]
MGKTIYKLVDKYIGTGIDLVIGAAVAALTAVLSVWMVGYAGWRELRK